MSDSTNETGAPVVKYFCVALACMLMYFVGLNKGVLNTVIYVNLLAIAAAK